MSLPTPRAPPFLLFPFPKCRLRDSLFHLRTCASNSSCLRASRIKNASLRWFVTLPSFNIASLLYAKTFSSIVVVLSFFPLQKNFQTNSSFQIVTTVTLPLPLKQRKLRQNLTLEGAFIEIHLEWRDFSLTYCAVLLKCQSHPIL